MINNQNIAVLSEKVAALEAAIKNAGIELPEVTSADNGKGLQVVNGAWATGAKIPAPLPTVSGTDNGKVLQVLEGVWAIGENIKVETVYTTTGLTILRCGDIVMYDFTGYTAKNNDDFPYTPTHSVRGVLTDTLRVVIGGGKIEIISEGTPVSTNTNLYGLITVIEY